MYMNVPVFIHKSHGSQQKTMTETDYALNNIIIGPVLNPP